MATDKDTIYIDIDDEITGIIDKLQASDGKVVALVLPKRAAVFQSIVNMKLLKRAADSSKKNLVLITSEAGLLPLAGLAGIHVAKTLSSKPEIPAGPSMVPDADEAVDEDSGEPEEVTAATAGDKPVGELAGAGAGAVETLMLDDDSIPSADAALGAEAAGGAVAAAATKAKPKKNKKLKIPDFDRFRLLVAGGILALILLIVFIILAVKVWPHATINIDTDAQNIDTHLNLNLSSSAKKLDLATTTLPAKVSTQQKTYTQSAATTGQKNNGNKASGSVNMSAGPCNSDVPSDVPAGTGLSSNGQTYITQSNMSFSPAVSHGKCTFQGTSSVTIIAQNPGSSYNGANSFTVAGRGDVSASAASSVSGGTDNIVRSVNQNDINNAKAKINTDDPSVKQGMIDQLKKDGYFVINATYSASPPNVTTSAGVGAVADNVTVTETVTYTVFGVKENDLKSAVDDSVKSQIDTAKQSILSEGLDKAVFNVASATATDAKVSMDTVATAGPDIDVASIQQSSAGKKAGQIKSDLENDPNIKSVDVNLSPFWVSSVPNKPSKIKVVIAKPKASANKNNANNP